MCKGIRYWLGSMFHSYSLYCFNIKAIKEVEQIININKNLNLHLLANKGKYW